jgi:hypothetical protein
VTCARRICCQPFSGRHLRQHIRYCLPFSIGRGYIAAALERQPEKRADWINRTITNQQSLTPKHGIRYALGLSLWGRWRLKLTPGGRCNGTLRRTIGDTIESVGNTRQFEGNLVERARPLQDDDAFAAEVKGDPE